jgi:putative hemolysin
MISIYSHTRLFLGIFILILCSACVSNQKPIVGMANPSSVNCVNKGGRVLMEKIDSGGTIGVCVFNDNKQCEEWALFRGECPLGGVDVSGLPKKERDCVIRGGSYKNKKCRLPK